MGATLVEVLFFLEYLVDRVNFDGTARVEPASLTVLPKAPWVRVSRSVAITLNPSASTRFPDKTLEDGVEFVVV